MNELLEKIAYCVEFGKINKVSPFPPDMKGQDGADELTIFMEISILSNDC